MHRDDIVDRNKLSKINWKEFYDETVKDLLKTFTFEFSTDIQFQLFVCKHMRLDLFPILRHPENRPSVEYIYRKVFGHDAPTD